MGHLVVQLLHLLLQLEDVALKFLGTIQPSDYALRQLVVQVFVFSLQCGYLSLVLFHFVGGLPERVGVAFAFYFNHLGGNAALQTFLF